MNTEPCEVTNRCSHSIKKARSRSGADAAVDDNVIDRDRGLVMRDPPTQVEVRLGSYSICNGPDVLYTAAL
jgi:hypothetical protein